MEDAMKDFRSNCSGHNKKLIRGLLAAMGHNVVTPNEFIEYGAAAKTPEDKVTPPTRRLSRKQPIGDTEDPVLPLPIFGLTLDES
eukprot:9683375-Heterocapsa_arctica.AAC.1